MVNLGSTSTRKYLTFISQCSTAHKGKTRFYALELILIRFDSIRFLRRRGWDVYHYGGILNNNNSHNEFGWFYRPYILVCAYHLHLLFAIWWIHSTDLPRSWFKPNHNIVKKHSVFLPTKRKQNVYTLHNQYTDNFHLKNGRVLVPNVKSKKCKPYKCSHIHSHDGRCQWK